MSNIKNFGLIGVGSELQFGKASSKIVNQAGTFKLRNSTDAADVALTAAGITSSAGNVTLTTGNLVLTATAGTLSVGGDTTLSRQAAGVFKFDGTGATMLPVGSTGQQPTGATGMVRINNTATPVLEYYNGTVWTQVAGTTALQTEIDKIEAALGASIDASGDFVNSFTGAAFASPTTFTQAIQQVANYAVSKDTLDEILPGTAGEVIWNNAGTWATDLPGATSGVQAYDAGLTALAAKTSTGILVQTAADTYSSVSLTAPAAGITISNADGVAGSPTFALANDLAALEGLATTGYIVRTGDGTATTRSVVGTAGNIVVTNGSGVSSDTSINLDTVSQAASGSFVKVTLDTYGRVTGNTAVVTADITALVDATYVNVSGDSMASAANLTFVGGGEVLGLPAVPSGDTAATSKAYVDAVAAGLSWKQAVRVATTANIDLASAPATIDGITLAANDRVLVKNQSAPAENGIYIFNGAASAMTRSTDMNTAPEFAGATVFVQVGTVNLDSGWTQTSEVVTVGTTAVNWVQFSGASAYIAGSGLDLTGNTFSVNVGAGITILPSDEVGIDVVAGKAVQLTGILSGSQLTFVLDGGAASGLEQSASGLKISADGVTNAMLLNDSFVTNADSGTNGSLALGGELEIRGTSTQGITTEIAGSIFTISASNASSSQKGVATFNTASFDVTAGDVTIKAAGVTNTQLVNSVITFTGTSGSDTVALGESMAIISADSAITTTMGTNSLSIQLNTVDVAHGGTGLTSLTSGQILVGNGTSPVALDADFMFNAASNTMTLGTSTFAAPAAGDLTITATATNADIVLVPNGTGSVIIGPSGSGLIQSDTGTALTVRGNTTLTLTSVTGDTTMALPSGTGSKVTVSGPTAADYATGLANEDLVNKQYVDTAIASGASAGSIKAVSVTVDLASAGATNIGAILPIGATILSVKVNVTAADTATGTLSVGKSGGVAAYMTTSENDTQTTGMYLAETMVTEAGAVQVIATVGGTPGGAGSAKVYVTYQVAA